MCLFSILSCVWQWLRHWGSWFICYPPPHSMISCQSCYLVSCNSTGNTQNTTISPRFTCHLQIHVVYTIYVCIHVHVHVHTCINVHCSSFKHNVTFVIWFVMLFEIHICNVLVYVHCLHVHVYSMYVVSSVYVWWWMLQGRKHALTLRCSSIICSRFSSNM